MIYRILVDEWTQKAEPIGDVDPGDRNVAGRRAPLRTLQGAGQCLGACMDYYELPAPKITNPRARFYFTEQGWQRVGRFVAEHARQTARIVKVVRRKNPDASQIIYADAWQMAILPRKA